MTESHCITHDLARVARNDRPALCFRRGDHFAACPDEETCRGCVPRSAERGMLCRVCWTRVTDSLTRVEELITHLRSIDTNGQAIGERVQTTMQKRLPLPDSWLAADGLLEALGFPPIPSDASIDEAFAIAADAVNAWGDVESIVSTREGAKRAVVLVKRLQNAIRRWPDSEAQYRHVPWILCPSCQQKTLFRRAPVEAGDDLVVECYGSNLLYDRPAEKNREGHVLRWELGYPHCEWMMHWDDFAAVYGPIFADIIEAEERAGGRRRRPRIVLDVEIARRGSNECAAREHDACVSLECSCDCHVRTYSLWTPKLSVNRMQELRAQRGDVGVT